MFDLSVAKIFFTIIIGLVVLGPKQITSIAIFLGRYWKKLNNFRDKIKDEFDEILDSDVPKAKKLSPILPKEKNLSKQTTSISSISSKKVSKSTKKVSKSTKINKKNFKVNNDPNAIDISADTSVTVNYPEYEIKSKIIQPMMSYEEALASKPIHQNKTRTNINSTLKSKHKPSSIQKKKTSSIKKSTVSTTKN